jgi:hypothetical protein
VSSVSITRTTALYPTKVFVQWDVASDESGSFFVDVSRAGGPAGPWESIAVGLREAYNFVDEAFSLPPSPPSNANGREPVNLFSLSKEIFYKVTVTPPSGGSSAFSSPPVPVEPGLDKRTRLLKRKLLRDLSVGFRRLNGVPLSLLKRRRWGPRCPDLLGSNAARGHARALPDLLRHRVRGRLLVPCSRTRAEGGGDRPDAAVRARRDRRQVRGLHPARLPAARVQGRRSRPAVGGPLRGPAHDADRAERSHRSPEADRLASRQKLRGVRGPGGSSREPRAVLT